MSAEASFADLLRRVRAGDAPAAVELVKKYEPAIRMEVRLRLRDQRLRRLFDSMDVCQSVLASFFTRAAAGQYDLEKPEQLVKLLVAITRNKVAFQARRQHAQRRDNRRMESIDPAETLESREIGPDRIVEAQDLLHAFRERLTSEERQLADLRGQGKSWEEIATDLGGTPNARRVQLARAADRVAREMGLD
jgi:RNA polymerase sigma-70 factor (ECF subfamily)